MADRQYPIPTQPNMGRGLVNHDERSKLYRAVEAIDQTRPRTYTWVRGRAYDQGEVPWCVAYTGKGILNSTRLSANMPYRKRIRLQPADLYHGAQLRDQWAGEAYEGTSGLGLCRYLKELGLITEYRWCFGLEETLLALSWIGPVGIGVNWREDMWEPDLGGYVHASGDAVGGHEVELTAINHKERRVTITNSWGTGWGSNGRAFLSWDDLGKLLADDGDAFILVR
jgi:hypothetical protein